MAAPLPPLIEVTTMSDSKPRYIYECSSGYEGPPVPMIRDVCAYCGSPNLPHANGSCEGCGARERVRKAVK